MKKAAPRARSRVRGLWPVIHIIEQSLHHSSSASLVAISLFKIDKKKSCVLSSFVPFLLLSFSSSSSVPLFVCSIPSPRSVLGHRLPLFLHHDALCINGNQIFKCVFLADEHILYCEHLIKRPCFDMSRWILQQGFKKKIHYCVFVELFL